MGIPWKENKEIVKDQILKYVQQFYSNKNVKLYSLTYKIRHPKIIKVLK